MTCQLPSRIVLLFRNSARRKYEARSAANARRISSSSIRNPCYHTISYSIHLSPSIYLYISIRTQAGRAQNGDSSCACIKFLYLRRRNKFRCNMAIVICPTEGT